MALKSKRAKPRTCEGLLSRLQMLLYEYDALGELPRAKPHILWLMEIAAKERAAKLTRRA
jgi:hypothetical protein